MCCSVLVPSAQAQWAFRVGSCNKPMKHHPLKYCGCFALLLILTVSAENISAQSLLVRSISRENALSRAPIVGEAEVLSVTAVSRRGGVGGYAVIVLGVVDLLKGEAPDVLKLRRFRLDLNGGYANSDIRCVAVMFWPRIEFVGLGLCKK